MKNILGIIATGLLVIVITIGLIYAFGWIGVHQTKTIGKAQQNAEREVFEDTQSYVESKRQEALKCYKEYQSATDEYKESIREVVALSFANFDESKLPLKLRSFVEKCKYGK